MNVPRLVTNYDFIHARSPSPCMTTHSDLEYHWLNVIPYAKIAQEQMTVVHVIHDKLGLYHIRYHCVPPHDTQYVLHTAQILFLWMISHTKIHRRLYRVMAIVCYFMMRTLWLDSEPIWINRSIVNVIKHDTTLHDVMWCKRLILTMTNWGLYMHPPFLTFRFLHDLRPFLEPDNVLEFYLPGSLNSGTQPLRQLVYEYACHGIYFAAWAKSILFCS